MIRAYYHRERHLDCTALGAAERLMAYVPSSLPGRYESEIGSRFFSAPQPNGVLAGNIIALVYQDEMLPGLHSP